MAYPPITNLPTPPSRQSPTTFSDDADAFLGSLPTFQTQLNAAGTYIETTAGTVQTSATAAATSATAAASSASAAASSASAAATSATTAAAAEAAVTSIYDDFDDRYLGAKAFDPTVDNDGDPLQEGTIYYNTTDSVIRLYDGSAWQQAVFGVDSAGALLTVNNLSDLASVVSARSNLGLGSAALEDASAFLQSSDLTAGTGIDVTGTTITNTAPDQTVVLTEGTGIDVTGTYPNFTITNTAPDQTVVLTEGSNVTITGTYPNFTISATDTNTNTTYSAGGGLSLAGTVFSHADTSAQASSNNSGTTFIQDIYLDDYGHITSIGTANVPVYSAGNGISLSGSTFTVSAGNGLSQTASGLQMSGSYTGSFTASGNVTAYSDERLKSDIKTIDNALDKVMSIRGVSYEKDGERNIGVIAQEVQKVIPEVVMQNEEYLSVAYGNIVGLLIEAVKEQQKQIEDLKTKLEG